MDDRLHHGNFSVTSQRRKARTNDRLAQEAPVLLGQVAARALPAARCHDDGCDRCGHVLRSQKNSSALPLARRGRAANSHFV
jgi:hypothetical protein